MLDSKLKKAFFSIYWSKGWRSTPVYPDAGTMDLLKQQGLIVDREIIHHDAVIERINKIILAYKPETLGDFFLAGLSRRKKISW